MKRETGLIACLLLVSLLFIPLLKTPQTFSQTLEKPASQMAQLDKLDSYIAKQMQVRQIPGVALAVVERGKIIFKKAYGVANLETDTPVKTSSVFELASVTKQFTAAAIMLLVEEGSVRLDEPISTYLRETPPTWKNITIRHLLTHTAGLILGAIATNEGPPLMEITTSQTFAHIAQAPLRFPAGENGAYSDAGYFLLGMIIEQAAGMGYREFMQKRIFDPLHMTDTSIMDKRKIIKNHVSVYGMIAGQLTHWRRDFQHELPSFYGLLSTLDDLAKWDAALRAGTLLKPTSLEQMWTAAKLSNGQEALVFGEPYGFGWGLGEIRGHRIAGHPGASGTYLLRFLDDDLTIILLTNLDASASQPALLARTVAGLLKPEYQPPHMLAAQADPSAQTTQTVRTVLSDLSEGQESPLMTAAYRTYYINLPPPLRQEQARILKALKSLTYLACDDVEKRGIKITESISRICYYKGEVEQRVFYFTAWLTREGKLAHLRFYQQ